MVNILNVNVIYYQLVRQRQQIRILRRLKYKKNCILFISFILHIVFFKNFFFRIIKKCDGFYVFKFIILLEIIQFKDLKVKC